MARLNEILRSSWFDVLRDELRIGFRMPYLKDVHRNLLAGHRLEVLTKRLGLRAPTADDHTRPGGVDRYPDPVGRALDLDPRHPRRIKALLHVLPKLQILVQQVGYFLSATT